MSDLAYHLVWCPKYRKAVLTPPIQERLKSIIRDRAEEHGWTIDALEVMPDHVHVLVRARVKDSPSYIANQFKGVSSNILRSEFPELRRKLPTLWSRSFFASTVGAVDAAAVRGYIDSQYERPWRKTAA